MLQRVRFVVIMLQKLARRIGRSQHRTDDTDNDDDVIDAFHDERR